MRGMPFSPDQTDVRARSDWRVIKTLLPFLWPRNDLEIRARVVVALVCIALAKGATVLIPIYLQKSVDAVGVDGVAAIPIGLIAAYGLARFLSQFFAQIRDVVFAKVGVRAVRRSAAAVLAHLHSLSLRFHLDRRTGGLSRSIERGMAAIESLVSLTLFNLAPTLLEVGMVFVILWRAFNIWFGLATLLTVAVYIAFTVMVTNWRLKFLRESNTLDARANTRAIDSLLNYETVKTYGNEAWEVAEYDRVMGRYETAAVKNQTSLSLLNMGQGFIVAIGAVVLMSMAAQGHIAGRMTVGDFILVNTYMLQLAQPLNFFGFMYRTVKQALVDLEKMFDLMSEETEIKDKPGAPPLKVSGGEVRFENVSFAYDPRRPILKNMSFTVAPGQMVAFVGATGSGKSTIGRLLFRYYDVTEGRILIDGQDIRDVTQQSLRAAIGVVPQDTVLFNNTLQYNLAYAKIGATPEEIEKAAELAHISTFIKNLPDGYDTTVGERGLKLSGGEKQRIAIARVILKGSPLLLFDEATSALDTHTEKDIQANLREVSTGRTTLVIAHRLSTIVDADQIFVVEEGAIVEQGTHHALLRQGGRYAAAWTKQQKSMEGGAEDTADGFAAKAAE
jgi:ATP-binding cassette subfamily B protein